MKLDPRLNWVRILRVLLVTATIPLLITGYAYIVESSWIEVTHLQVNAPITGRLKIAQLSDLHTRGMNRVERRLIDLLAQERPDLIVITGDSIADEGTYEDVYELYDRLHAPLGVYLVNGNWEHWRPPPSGNRLPSHVKILHNTSQKIRDHLFLVGLDDAVTGVPDLAHAIRGIPPQSFRIGLFHSPVFFDESSDQFQVALAGHTHGGQIRLPFFGPLWLPPGSGAYVQGWYSRGSSRLYVSRGIGTSVLPLRLLCRPELVIVELGKVD